MVILRTIQPSAYADFVLIWEETTVALDLATSFLHDADESLDGFGVAELSTRGLILIFFCVEDNINLDCCVFLEAVADFRFFRLLGSSQNLSGQYRGARSACRRWKDVDLGTVLDTRVDLED
jgi:hypothetical protein